MVVKPEKYLECLSGHSSVVCVGAASPGAATEDAGLPAHMRPGSQAGRGMAVPRPQRVHGRPTPPAAPGLAEGA